MQVSDLFEGSFGKLLYLTPYKFDQTIEGWRSLPSTEQQKQIINQYFTKWSKSIIAWSPYIPQEKKNRSILPFVLVFHLAQIHAFDNERISAIKLLNQISATDDVQWNNYVNATIAFLKMDRAAFDKFAVEPNYNMKTLNRLRLNWGKNYKAAYNAA